MAVFNTNTFAGAAGAAWPSFSNAETWTYNTYDQAFAVAPSDVVDGSNHGTDTATANANAANVSTRTMRATTNTHTNAQITAVVQRSTNSLNASSAPNLSLGLMLNKLAASMTGYIAYPQYVFTGGKLVGNGIIIMRANANTYTGLLSNNASVTGFSDYDNVANSFVFQFRATAVDGGASTLLQARVWTGTNPATPPVDWTVPGLPLAATNYHSCAVLDASPLGAGYPGFWVRRLGGSASSVATYSQYELRDVFAVTPTTATRSTSTTLVKNIGVVKTVSVSQTITYIRAITKTVTSATQSVSAILTRGIAKSITVSSNLVSSLSKGVSKSLTVTLTASTNIAKTLSKTLVATTTPVVSVVRAVGKSITTGIATIASVATQYIASFVYDPLGRVLRLTGRTTLRLIQPTLLRLRGRTNLRLPKE